MKNIVLMAVFSFCITADSTAAFPDDKNEGSYYRQMSAASSGLFMKEELAPLPSVLRPHGGISYSTLQLSFLERLQIISALYKPKIISQYIVFPTAIGFTYHCLFNSAQ